MSEGGDQIPLIDLIYELMAFRGTLFKSLVVIDSPLKVSPLATLSDTRYLDCEFLDKPIETLNAINTYQPDVVVMDFEQDEVSQVELAVLMQSTSPHLPVIFLGYKELVTKELNTFNLENRHYLYIKNRNKECVDSMLLVHY